MYHVPWPKFPYPYPQGQTAFSSSNHTVTTSSRRLRAGHQCIFVSDWKDVVGVSAVVKVRKSHMMKL
jgi:hypothetical protein